MFSVQYTLASTIEGYEYVGIRHLAFGYTPSLSQGTSPVSDPIDALSDGVYRFNLVGFWAVDACLSLVNRVHGAETEFAGWGWFNESEPYYGLQRVNVSDGSISNQKKVAMSFHSPLYITQEQVDNDDEFNIVFGPTNGTPPNADVHVSYLIGENWVKFTYLGDA